MRIGAVDWIEEIEVKKPFYDLCCDEDGDKPCPKSLAH